MNPYEDAPLYYDPFEIFNEEIIEQTHSNKKPTQSNNSMVDNIVLFQAWYERNFVLLSILQWFLIIVILLKISKK